MNNFLKVLLLFCLSHNVLCDECYFLVRGNRPTLLRKVGKKTFIDQKSYNNYNGDQRIYLRRKETIELFCESGFITNDNSDVATNIKSLSLECIELDYRNTRLTFTNDENEQWFRIDQYFECNFDNLQIYESNKTLQNCENYVSYGLTTGLNSAVGICYDLDAFEIKYAKYIGNRPYYNFLHQKAATNQTVVDLDVELNNFDFLLENSFMSTQTFNTLYAAKKTELNLLKPFQFEYECLVQDETLNKYFKKFNPLFNVVWWRELRQGNWLHFQNALNERLQNFTYMIYTGVSGSMTIPTNEKNEILQVNEGDKFVRTPAYIWSYLESLEENFNEEFVIVAHNTPFYKTGVAIEFCKDICHEIDWLNKSLFGKLHFMPVFGVVNCCRPVDVAGKLDNFPIVFKNSTEPVKPNSTTEKVVIE